MALQVAYYNRRSQRPIICFQLSEGEAEACAKLSPSFDPVRLLPPFIGRVYSCYYRCRFDENYYGAGCEYS